MCVRVKKPLSEKLSLHSLDTQNGSTSSFSSSELMPQWLHPPSVPHHRLVQTSQRTIGQGAKQMEIRQLAEITDGYRSYPPPHQHHTLFTPSPSAPSLVPLSASAILRQPPSLFSYYGAEDLRSFYSPLLFFLP